REIYLTVDSDEYITDRIKEGMLGAFVDEELAGFIGTHEDGSIGLLEVLPKFRRKGIGRALETQMVKRLWSLNRRAFGNIAQDNTLSRTVHEKIGLPISKKPVYWLFPPEY
ncbi:MAG: GNAT family N-acetyltransferase, partial [Clostridium sp.]|nr:GNAT family N-acetyltransferase [Clostridium sp.]